MKISRYEQNGKGCVLVEQLSHFDLGQIRESGQCFRIRQLPVSVDPKIRRSFSICWGARHIRVDEWNQPETFLFHCNEREFADQWFSYFGLDHDYFRTLQRQLADDPFLAAAAQYGSGIRILRQDFWEILISFMISQNNNIRRIQASIEALCKAYGKMRDDRGMIYYTFPTPRALEGADLGGLGLGYRQGYLEQLISQAGISDWLRSIRTAKTYDEAKKQLLQIRGIGEKVANCILLYGLHYMDAYPIDTWIQKMIHTVYGGRFDTTPYQGYAGYVQQLQFYYFRTQCKKRAEI